MAVPVQPAGAEVVLGRRKREWPLALLLLLPSAAVFGVFVFYPLARTIQLGMYRSDPFGGLGRYVGPSQYWDVLSSASFRQSLGVTFKFAALTVPTGLALGLGLAVLGHQQLKGIGIYRTIFSSTVATSVAVASLMWLTLLNPSVGLINQALDKLGHQPIIFLQSPGWAMLSVAAATVWQNLGFTFVVISAGLQSVPDELLESARIDGAGPWRRFREITLPLLSPTLLFAFIVLSINAFQTFGQVDLLTHGGPLHSTELLVYQVFERSSNDPSTAAVEAVVLFAIILVLTLVQLRVLERRVHYGD
ncbi:MAG: permease component of ABC-type sugar transporter [Actinomycetia bacterium]|nr:permease component of ABC-type sugar transporter [Actinomycetes bacterium]